MWLFAAILLTWPGQILGAAEPASAWVWPLDPPPQVVRGFEPPPEPWLAGHRGVDLAATAGQDVKSAGAGHVAFAGMVAGRPVVSVTHGALRTTYEPVHALVKAGEAIGAGEIIGTLSAAPSHCGPGRPCLHWGLRHGEQYLDPLALLGEAPIRLLPLWDSGGPPPVEPATGGATPSVPTARRGRSTATVTIGALVAAGGLALAGYRRRT